MSAFIGIDVVIRKLKSVLLCGLLMVCWTGVAAAQNPTYLNLPVGPNTLSLTYGVNSAGQILGSYLIETKGQQLFIWNDGVTTLVGQPIPGGIWFAAINNLGQVAYTTNLGF